MASVKINNVYKQFGETRVLEDFSVGIEDGEFLVLVGPSGCGKSTLLRMIAGLEPITDGTIEIGDRVVNKLPPKERDISMVFQNYALYPHLTVAENMAFSLTLAHAPKSEKDERVADAARVLGLTELLHRKPKQLSGGQRQRVAMGRSIVRNPRVFLFDEPLSNLDAKLRVAMRAEIKALHHKLGNTAIYVTHDQVEAMTMADRIVVMNAGRIEQIGAPLELYDNPANVFVAGFIGTPMMNLLKGRVDLNGGAPSVQFDGGVSLPLPETARLEQGAEIIYGVRPEHCRIAAEGAPAKVSVVEPMGPETHLLLTFGSAPIVIAVRERLSPKPDETVNFIPDLQHVIFFDPASGAQL